MTEQEVYNKIKEIIVTFFDVSPDSVTETTNIQDDLGADSIKIMEFVLELEDAFGAEISDEAAETILTVGDAATYIANNQNEN